MKQAALRGLIFGLIAAITLLAMPFGFRLGMWAHSKVSPPHQQVLNLNIR